MKLIGFLLVSLIPLCHAQQPSATSVTGLLKVIENRYNKVATLQMNFAEHYTFQNRPRPAEWGVLYLKKPGKMRWAYQKPSGKLFISDSKDLYYFTPAANRVEKLRIKEADDMRAPMAFLLGKLDFDRDFSRYTSTPDGAAMWIACEPKNQKAMYTEVAFKVYPDGRIERLRVTGQDRSILEFEFAEEKPNVKLADSMFQFQTPQGAEFIDLTAQPGKN